MKTRESNPRCRAHGIVAAALLATFSIGCGSTTKVSSETNASVGQQLLDLEKARDKGIITDKEYEKLRKAIVKKNH